MTNKTLTKLCLATGEKVFEKSIPNLLCVALVYQPLYLSTKPSILHFILKTHYKVMYALW